MKSVFSWSGHFDLYREGWGKIETTNLPRTTCIRWRGILFHRPDLLSGAETVAKSVSSNERALPKGIWIELTNACNLKCSWCYQSTGSMSRRRGMMSFQTYRKIISEVESFRPMVMLHLAGESFLHQGLFDFVEYAKQHGLIVGITTNGTLLSRDNFGILNTGIDEINISLAGVNKEDYFRVRGTQDFDWIKKGIMDLAKKKIERKSATKIYVVVTATQQNRNDLASFDFEFGQIEGIEGVKIKSLMDWQGAVDIANMEIRSGFKPRLKMFIRSHEQLFFLFRVARRLQNDRIPSLCKEVYLHAGILWDGTVVPCCLDYDGSINLGNINEKRFLEIYNGEAMARLRGILRSVKTTRHHPVCGPCLFHTFGKSISLHTFVQNHR